MNATRARWTDPLRTATRSLRFKMAVGVLSFMVMISVLLSSLFVIQLGASEEASSTRLVEDATVVLAATITEEVRRGDAEGIRERLGGFLTDSRILYVVVSTPRGELARFVDGCPPDLADYLESAPEAGPMFHAYPLPGGDGRRLEVVVPVQAPAAEGGELGRVRVGYSLRAASMRVEELRWRAAMITFTLIVMGAAGTMFL
ncbi:MAG TPA: hypothetical protein VKU85_07810, partial [bacterium]|nr:hypothetical protein [bacterium]